MSDEKLAEMTLADPKKVKRCFYLEKILRYKHKSLSSFKEHESADAIESPNASNASIAISTATPEGAYCTNSSLSTTTTTRTVDDVDHLLPLHRLVGDGVGEPEEGAEAEEVAAGQGGLRERDDGGAGGVEGVADPPPRAENAAGERLGEAHGDALHGVAIGSGQEADLLEEDVGLLEVAGGYVVGAAEEEVNEAEPALVGLELPKPRRARRQ
ncbi:hypothetical protein Cni_G06413 [Canna indica]|uniref:Uncharacterized protein n=1 Tax=Canna indica TaxID=4628 RepID=A0AAQ3Q5W8_9LILI|nr:hypothetical protein Cni_G06413 [Canna indica]